MKTKPFTYSHLLTIGLTLSTVDGFSTHHSRAPPRHSNYREHKISHIDRRNSNTVLHSSERDLDAITNGRNPMAKDASPSIIENFRLAASEGFGTKARNAAATMKVGDVIVPLCGNLAQRQILANRGIYPGVEYEVTSLQLNNKEIIIDNLTSTTDRDNVVAYMKPAYKLRPHLERDDFPVPVKPFQDVPLWLSKATWLGSNLLGTFLLSFSYLSIAAILAFFVRFTFVPTESMIPALNPGDVAIVTRSIPIGPLKTKVGDVVLFDPPYGLNDRISSMLKEQKQQGGKDVEGEGVVIGTDADKEQEVMSMNKPQQGEQFLKRVVAVSGETVGVKNAQPFVTLSDKDSDINEEKATSTRQFRVDIIGNYAYPELFPPSSWERQAEKLDKNTVFVAGDNGFRSVDSRVWGPLQERNIFGKAQWVIWPIEHFGPVKPGQIYTIEK